MTPAEIYDLIVKIAATKSTKEKTALVAGCGHPNFLRVLKAAYDPTVTYGVRELPEPAPKAADPVELDDATWAVVDGLAARTLTGDAAKAAIAHQLGRLDEKSATLLTWVLKKDLRAGFGSTIINKAHKGLIPEFPYMRCSLPKHVGGLQSFIKGTAFSQEKADGMFTNAKHGPTGDVELSTRQGTMLPLDEFADIVADVQKLARSTVTHGELEVIGPDGVVLARELGNGMLNSVAQGGKFETGHKPRLRVWDQVPLEHFTPGGKYEVPYKDRLSLLIGQIKGADMKALQLIDTRVVSSAGEAHAHYAELLGLGKEGTIVKSMGAIWRDSTSKEQIKLKLEVTVDLVITGYVAGSGKNADLFGSVTAETCDGLLRVDVSGFTDEMRKHIHENRERYMGTIMAVRANEIMFAKKEGDVHSLFLPRFVELRADKTLADSFAQVVEQFEQARTGGAG